MKLTLAVILLVCVAFQAGQCKTVGQAVDATIDWTGDTIGDAYDALKGTANWVGDKIEDVLPDSVKELASDLGDTVSDAASDIKDTLGDAASEMADDIDDAV